MDFFIYLIIIIFYIFIAISRASDNHEGRYGLIGVDNNFSLAFDPLERVRGEYNRRLQIYYSTNKPRTYLKNNYCELRLVKDGSGVHFYCKEKTNGKKSGRFFEVKGNNDHVSTMWGIMDMEFGKNSTYSLMRSVYMRLNQASNTTGGLRYFHEPWLNKNKYPKYNGRYVQNEYCRMELQTLENGKNVILCSDVWSKKDKQFMIIANKHLLMNIINKFENEVDKFVMYSDLLVRYSKRDDCTVRVIEPKEESLEENNIKVSKTENVQDNLSQIKPSIVEEEKVKEPESYMQDSKNNVKYNERNLDL